MSPNVPQRGQDITATKGFCARPSLAWFSSTKTVPGSILSGIHSSRNCKSADIVPSSGLMYLSRLHASRPAQLQEQQQAANGITEGWNPPVGINLAGGARLSQLESKPGSIEGDSRPGLGSTPTYRDAATAPLP